MAAVLQGPAPACTPWCERPMSEGHIACGALLGTVILAEQRIDVKVAKFRDSLPMMMFTISGDGPERTVAMNTVRAAELIALGSQGLELLLGPTNVPS